MSVAKGFISVDAALGLDRSAIRANYQQYINPGLVTLLGLLDADKRFVRASGVSLWDQDGNEYLDFLGAYGAMNTGHNHFNQRPKAEGAHVVISPFANTFQRRPI